MFTIGKEVLEIVKFLLAHFPPPGISDHCLGRGSKILSEQTPSAAAYSSQGSMWIPKLLLVKKAASGQGQVAFS